MSATHWYCIHTKPKSEPYTIEQLSIGLGLEVYFPRMQRVKLIRRVRRTIIEPIFPQYVFCRFDLGTSYRAVRYARDVLDVVRFGSEPSVVPDELIEELRSCADVFAKARQAQESLSNGDRVEICAGPMRGLNAVILDAANEKDRVDVLLSILGGEARLSIRRSELAKAV
jgi:transcriptional antiterminator RfaH